MLDLGTAFKEGSIVCKTNYHIFSLYIYKILRLLELYLNFKNFGFATSIHNSLQLKNFEGQIAVLLNVLKTLCSN